ncbi:hypothetical protein DFQ30_003602 [Apophysomyces sp. BC1015]|nr:hypothetical protein DFQ29_008287 [Apophysomyces sp. BC1021]KAG0174614.1 hypothetical protein DFQ30_003602 [Apophysomyces sp. BC1015]
MTSTERKGMETPVGHATTTGGFIRPMSPVTVNYPYSNSTDTAPLTRPLSPPTPQHAQRNIAVEDPYSSQPLTFSMVSPKRIESTEIPMQTLYHHQSTRDNSNMYSPEAEQYYDDTAGRGSSWEQNTSAYQPSQALSSSARVHGTRNQDWLWQSPERRNSP